MHRVKPREQKLARTRDGGRTWSIEQPAELVPIENADVKPVPLTEPIDFTRPGFALTLRFAICWHVLGQPISLRAALLVAVAHNLLAIVNVTPGNLGLRELVISVLSGELGSSRTIGLAAASVERAVSLLYAVLVGLPGIHSLRNRGRAAQPS